MYVIRKGIPVPSKDGSNNHLYRTLDKMDVGDSFIVDDAGPSKISAQMTMISKKTNKRFISRMVDGYRNIWRLS